MVSLCAILILPVNGLRIYLLYDQFRDSAMVLFFSIMYLQNISLCITELQFIAYCFGLYLKYRSINEDMAILKSRTITINRYPSALNPGKYNSICDSSGSNYDICQTIKECQLVNSIESFRMRHRFVSDSVNDLNDIYSIQLGLSLFILLVMALFDIYEVVLTEYNIFQTYEMLLMWLSQYAFRFSMIVLTTHFTTKQANKSKMILTDINNRYTDYNTKEEAYTTKTLIADINNRYLDETTKEELYLFFNQIRRHSVEFTSCDLFTLHPHLITTYKKNIEKFHLFTPMTQFETEVLKKVSSRIVILCLLLTVPNMSMYYVETHFTFLCFILYQKFVGINKDLMALKIDTVVRNKYPFMLRAREKYGKNFNSVDYNRDVLQTLAGGHSMANFVEQLKVKHRLAREAVNNLNDLFGVQLGLSMCSLCLFSMFDLYYHIRGIMNPTKSNILLYGWILQYTVRFGSVTILAHLTSKQALKSKVLITDINNRYLDKNTKEEIQLFLNQMCSCAIEFTACDFFTLNTHLITSVC
ncbi:hypothetical protein AGLY_015983 [Aphis glycines]|uniref:Gustatory receptor n=1 Tax=Aphis glycines TaxID=307491 RepID=A0A6G0T0H5_APHGL|nr:hypothetical protein AGLY_015983 [Aphis glycines]